MTIQRVLILALFLIHACAMHILSQDIIVRPPNEPAQPLDFRLEFSSLWGIKVNGFFIDYLAANVVLKCYAVLNKGKSQEKVHMRDYSLKYQDREVLAFYIKPGVYSSFSVQCDYWHKFASNDPRKGGVVLSKTKTSPRVCLAKDGGCEIRFENGIVTQRTPSGKVTFLGELPIEKCDAIRPIGSSWGLRYYCKQIRNTGPMFGSYCQRSTWQFSQLDCDAPEKDMSGFFPPFK